jgi:hypothetical protein
MKHLFSLGTLMVAALLVSEGLWGDEPKQLTTPPVRVRRSLPTYWSKLGLSDEQKQKVYAAQAEYGIKIDALQKQIKDLQKQQRAAMEKVLTEAQKTRLREIVAEKLPKATAPKDDKKPDSKPAPADKKP